MTGTDDGLLDGCMQASDKSNRHCLSPPRWWRQSCPLATGKPHKKLRDVPKYVFRSMCGPSSTPKRCALGVHMGAGATSLEAARDDELLTVCSGSHHHATFALPAISTFSPTWLPCWDHSIQFGRRSATDIWMPHWISLSCSTSPSPPSEAGRVRWEHYCMTACKEDFSSL